MGRFEKMPENPIQSFEETQKISEIYDEFKKEYKNFCNQLKLLDILQNLNEMKSYLDMI